MRKLWFVSLFLLLFSCEASTNRNGADGYTFGEPSYEKTRVTITLITYKTRKEFLDASKKRGVKSNTVAAFAELKPPFDTCTIHVMDPRVKYEPEFYGHELAHCFYGQWHTSNNDRE